MASIGDNSLGPRLPGAFDFTLKFEQAVMTIPPAAAFILIAAWRGFAVYKKPVCTNAPKLLNAKLAVASLLAVFQLVIIALWSVPSTPKTGTAVASAVVAFLATLASIPLSLLEHRKSQKQSPAISGFLLLSLVLDLAQARSLWLRNQVTSLAVMFTLCMVCKMIMLVLEETPKRFISTEKERIREVQSGIINRSIFFWLNDFMLLGSKKALAVGDIGAIHPKLASDVLLDQLEETWRNTDKKDSKHKLLRTVVWTFRGQLYSGVVPRLLFSACTLSQPFLINRIITYIAQPLDERNPNFGNGLIGAAILIYISMAVTNAWYRHTVYQLMTMYRGALVSLVYKKTLDLVPTTVKDSAPTTLMSTDVEGIATGIVQVHDIWASFLELPVALYLLYRQVGIPSLFIIIPALITTVSGGLLSPKLGPARIVWNKAVEVRVGDTSNMLSQIKAVKMTGLGEFFRNRLIELRASELALSVKFRWVLIKIEAIANTAQNVTPVVVILCAIFWTKSDSGLSVSEAFTSLSIIAIASTPIINILISFMQIFGVVGCFTRLQTFLNQPVQFDPREQLASPRDEKDITRGSISNISQDSNIELQTLPSADLQQQMVRFEDATFGVDATDILNHISLDIARGSFTMIVGRVGCGKSSLLKAMIGELELKSGSVQTAVKEAAYCDQTPWIINLSIRDNIVGQSELDEEWLSTVVHACALDEDVARLRAGVDTVVGTGGISLSGGQKQRLALARAVYSRKRFVVLDDIFSGLDNKTAHKVFQRVFTQDGLLRRDGQTIVLATNHVNFLPAADFITMLDQGSVSRNQVPYDAFDASEWGISDDDKSQSEFDGGEEPREDFSQLEKSKTEEVTKEIEAEISRQTGDTECYIIFFRAMGWKIAMLLIAFCVVGVVLEKFPQVFLRLWTQVGTRDAGFGYMGGYIATALASALFITIGITILFAFGIPRYANRLHTMLLDSVMRAPLHFFTKTDNGVTLNRFSQDMNMIDQALPMAMFGTILLVAQCLVETGIILSGSSYMGALLPVGIIVLYFIQQFYLRTSRQIRLLDLEMKSPLYTQFSETISGLSTIRAFGWSAPSRAENMKRLNTSQRPYYMLFCIQRWLQVVLDLFSAGMALVLVSFALKLPWSTSEAAFGLAMVNIISFNMTLTNVITAWTSLETSLGAIARLKWFINNTPNENKPEEKEQPSADWPSEGGIELNNVTARYSEDGPAVLKNVSFKIKPGQKVGVCGRSGSGKSSLIAVLGRLLEIDADSSIVVDGFDLKTVPRQTIRSRLTALPQDALKLSGTVRRNLDPAGTISADQVLIDALTKTTIWPFIESRGGLDGNLDDMSLSAGQMQLFSLSRAILRGGSTDGQGSLVLLDEATSSVDRQTDDEVRTAIQSDLEGRTVIEVAHHLDIVRNYDVIIVLGAGNLLEIGHPDELLARPDSEFYSLWASRGL